MERVIYGCFFAALLAQAIAWTPSRLRSAALVLCRPSQPDAIEAACFVFGDLLLVNTPLLITLHLGL